MGWDPGGAKRSKEKLGATYPWLSAPVSVHRARDILLMIHRARTLRVTKQEVLRDLSEVWKLPWCFFFLAGVVCWQRTLGYCRIRGILAMQTSISPASRAGGSPCWDACGLGISFPFDFS